MTKKHLEKLPPWETPGDLFPEPKKSAMLPERTEEFPPVPLVSKPLRPKNSDRFEDYGKAAANDQKEREPEQEGQE